MNNNIINNNIHYFIPRIDTNSKLNAGINPEDIKTCLWKIKLIKYIAKYYHSIEHDINNNNTNKKWNMETMIDKIDSYLLKHIKLDINMENENEYIIGEIYKQEKLAYLITCILCSENEELKSELILGECIYTFYKFIKLTGLHKEYNYDNMENECKKAQKNLYECLEYNNFEREYIYLEKQFLTHNDDNGTINTDMTKLCKRDIFILHRNLDFLFEDNYNDTIYNRKNIINKLEGLFYIPIDDFPLPSITEIVCNGYKGKECFPHQLMKYIKDKNKKRNNHNVIIKSMICNIWTNMWEYLIWKTYISMTEQSEYRSIYRISMNMKNKKDLQYHHNHNEIIENDTLYNKIKNRLIRDIVENNNNFNRNSITPKFIIFKDDDNNEINNYSRSHSIVNVDYDSFSKKINKTQEEYLYENGEDEEEEKIQLPDFPPCINYIYSYRQIDGHGHPTFQERIIFGTFMIEAGFPLEASMSLYKKMFDSQSNENYCNMSLKYFAENTKYGKYLSTLYHGQDKYIKKIKTNNGKEIERGLIFSCNTIMDKGFCPINNKTKWNHGNEGTNIKYAKKYLLKSSSCCNDNDNDNNNDNNNIMDIEDLGEIFNNLLKINISNSNNNNEQDTHNLCKKTCASIFEHRHKNEQKLQYPINNPNGYFLMSLKANSRGYTVYNELLNKKIEW